MKLKAKYLAPYLPYDLQVEYRGKAITLDALDSTGGAYIGKHRIISFVNQQHIKPILRPIHTISNKEAKELISVVYGYPHEDLEVDVRRGRVDKFYGDMVSICWKNKYKEAYKSTIKIYLRLGIFTNGLTPYSLNEWLFRHHFDVFGLIDNDLAISK